MTIRSITRIWLSGTLLGAIAMAGEGQPDNRTFTREEIEAITERAKSDPEALRQLKGAPIAQVFDSLSELWSHSRYSVEARKAVRSQGEEEENRWLESERKWGQYPDTAEQVYSVSKDLLFSHPDLEAYLAVKIKEVNFHLTYSYLHHAIPPGAGPVPGPIERYLGVALNMPGDAAFRLAGSYLSVVDHPDIDGGDYTELSPAKKAQRTMARLVKQRLNEDIPNDVEGTRKWWAENQHRFSAKPEPVAEPPGAAPQSNGDLQSKAVPQPGASSPVKAATPGQELPAVAAVANPVTKNDDDPKWPFVAVGALLLILLGLATRLRARSGRLG